MLKNVEHSRCTDVYPKNRSVLNLNRFISLTVTLILYIATLVVKSADVVLADEKFIYGVAALSIVIFSIFLKRSIWIYLFSTALILAFVDVISIYAFSFELQLGGFNMNLVTLILILLHFAFNVDVLTFKRKK